MGGDDKKIIDEAFRKALTDVMSKFITVVLIAWVGLAIMAFKSFYSLEKRMTINEFRQVDCEETTKEMERIIKSIHDKLEIMASGRD